MGNNTTNPPASQTVDIPAADSVAARQRVTCSEALRYWLKLGFINFGGPAGQIAIMHRDLVERLRWISEDRFLHALNYCMLLPGPEAQQLATYVGWLLHGTLGGIIAGSLFIIPGFLTILLLSVLYAGFQQVSMVQALFFGLKPAVMAVVVEAVIRIGRRTLKNEVMVGLAATAFVAIFFLDVPFPVIVLSAGVIGYIGGRFWPEKFHVVGGHQTPHTSPSSHSDTVITDAMAVHAPPSLARSVRVALVCLLFWFGPFGVLLANGGWANIYVTEAGFFSKMAVVTFGGAYAVLAYVAQQAVNTYGWLHPGEMLDGLGMAETTPGPLIQVVQFVGFMGAFRDPGPLHPMVAGVLGAIVATWFTFVPCFLFIFLGAPYIEALRGNRSLSTALSGITAAVVGVILNLAVWFSLHVVFGTVETLHIGGIRLLVPEWATLDLVSFLIAIGAFVAMFRYRAGMIPTLAGSAGVGLLYHLLFRA